MEPTAIAIDLSKRVFQIHYVQVEFGTIRSKVLKRPQLVPFFATGLRVVSPWKPTEAPTTGPEF